MHFKLHSCAYRSHSCRLFIDNKILHFEIVNLLKAHKKKTSTIKRMYVSIDVCCCYQTNKQHKFTVHFNRNTYLLLPLIGQFKYYLQSPTHLLSSSDY